MSDYTIVKWQDVPNNGERLGLPATSFEMRTGRKPLGCSTHGVSFAKFGAGFKPTLGHRQKQQEEVYVILTGTAEANLDGEIVEIPSGSAIRVAPEVWRAFRAKGDEDVTMIITGSPAVDDDGEINMEYWPA